MEKTITFIPIDYDYFDYEGKNYAKIVGRTADGKRACIVDNCDVCLWAILKERISETKINELREKIEKLKVKSKLRESRVVKTEVHNKKFLSRNVKAIKIFITNYKDARDFADKLTFPEIDKRREHDLGFITKYIIEKKLKPLNWYEVKGNIITGEDFGGVGNIDIDLVIKADKIEKLDDSYSSNLKFSPRILAYDIETDEFEIGKGHILMISLVGENFKKILTWKGKSNKNYVENFKNEEEMIEKFVEYVKNYNPDILTGYFSDGFDLPYLRARAEKNNIKLSLGIDNSQPSFTRGRLLTGRINGIVHVDLFRFIKVIYSQYLQSETLGLNEVASELLGEKKSEWRHIHSSKIAGEKWNEYFEYCLHDSVLTYKLAEKIWPDLLEFTKIIQEPLFDVSRYSMSNQVEGYIIHNTEKFNEIIEKKPLPGEIGERLEEERYEGGYVLQPTPGLYEDLVFFDFTSMYGSIIVTFNLSKSSFLEKKELDSLEVNIGKKVYFLKKPAFFPEMLKEIIEKRKKFKEEYNKAPSPLLRARSNAFKLLTNAAYGYQGFFGARYYCREAAAATAALARKLIKETINNIKKEGHEVIYADTDSVVLLQGKKTKKEILDLLDDINKKLPGIMELDLEDFYKRGIWVTKRTGEFGAKKKYALIDENDKMRVRGFETVRRDWCDLARETQNKVLELILKNGNEKKAIEYLKEIVKKIKSRQVDLTKLVIRTQLKKSIQDYKLVGPHVIIAKKMKEKNLPVNIGMLVEYYIAESNDKKALIRERAKMIDEKGKYDIDYYLKNQILPAVENIFDVFNIKVNELLDGKRQASLGDF